MAQLAWLEALRVEEWSEGNGIALIFGSGRILPEKRETDQPGILLL